MDEELQSKINKIIELNELIDKAIVFRSNLKNEVKDICPEECNNFTKKSDYFPGSYLDRPTTSHYASCNICGKYKDIRYVTHSRGY